MRHDSQSNFQSYTHNQKTIIVKEQVSWPDFEKMELRIGTIVEASNFPEAKKPAFKLRIDFGEFGIKHSSAQITDRYTPSALVGMQIAAVLNFPSKRIAGFMSECLVLGAYDKAGAVVLLQPQQAIINGAQIG